MRPELSGPVAVDRISDSEFFVLSSDGSIRRLLNTGNNFQQVAKFSVQGFPIDFTYSVSEGVASVFVCSAIVDKGVISRYSTDGALMKHWWLWHTCGGLDFDPQEHMLYVASTDTNEIYRLDVRKDGQLESIGELPIAGKLGPIVVDSDRKLVYASDIAEGKVYEYDVAKRFSRVIAANLGSPVALFFDAKTKLLYVADATAKRILALTINRSRQGRQSSILTSRPTKQSTSNLTVRVLLQSANLRSPSGVVPAGNGELVISDYGANRIFVVSSNGQVSFQYPQ
jgi:hypothetical protein